MASKFFGGIFRIQLNADQQEILKFAAEGHNLLITGQAGVGKSEVVKRIIATLNARGKTILKAKVKLTTMYLHHEIEELKLSTTTRRPGKQFF